MPKVAYSQEDRDRIRQALTTTALELMARQGIQHTTVEQIYKKVGISRTFFYSFFPTKEDLIVETLYLQQPRILALARKLAADPALTRREAIRTFLHACCYGREKRDRRSDRGGTAADLPAPVTGELSTSGTSRPSCSATF